MTYSIYLVDHGLYETKKSPVFYKAISKLLTYTDLANYCKLAYLWLPKVGHALYDKVIKFLNDLIDTVNNFTIVDEDDSTYYVVVNETGQDSLNF